MTYSQTIEYIHSRPRFAGRPGLDRIKQILSCCGNPQKSVRFIHVAGTNGKGSVGAFINSVLSEAGYKTGRYVSPAVMDYLEKIQYNNKNISEEEFASAIEKDKKAAD